MATHDWPGPINLPPTAAPVRDPFRPILSVADMRRVVELIGNGRPPDRIKAGLAFQRFNLSDEDLWECLILRHRGVI